MASSEEAEESTLEYTPTWTVAVVCAIFVIVSLLLERGIHRLGKVSGFFYLFIILVITNELMIIIVITMKVRITIMIRVYIGLWLWLELCLGLGYLL